MSSWVLQGHFSTLSTCQLWFLGHPKGGVGKVGCLLSLIGEPVFGHQILWARGVKKATCIHAKCHRLTLAAWAPKSSP